MRTTLTLEPVIAERINRIVATRGKSMKEIVNEALREGLRVMEQSPVNPPPRFVVHARHLRVRPGIDLDTIGRFADDLEDEDRMARLKARNTRPGKVDDRSGR